MNWERRSFEPVELRVDTEELRAHGRRGGWITAVLRDDDGVRLLGMRPL
jgi:prephenate dehydrogenase